MKFRWWYVSMGATVVVILGGMMYLGPFLCVPVENMPCQSLLPDQGKMVPAGSSTQSVGWQVPIQYSY